MQRVQVYGKWGLRERDVVMRRVERRVRREEWQDLQDLGRHKSAAYKGRAKNSGVAMFKIADFDASTSSSRLITFFPGTNLSLTGSRGVFQ